MSEKSDPTRGEPLESQADGSQSKPAEEHKVGPGSPPPDKRWQKGGPSPNPRGRPRKEQSMLLDVRKAFEQAINKKVSVPRGDKMVLMTRVEIGLEQLLNQFAKGDRHARRGLMEYADKLDIDFLAKHKQTLEQALTPNYQAILEASFARRTGAGNVAPATRVVASPELLDDDAAEPEPTLPSPPPKAKIEPELEPPLKPGVNYPKPYSQMTPLQRRAWYPDWPAQKQRLLQERAKAAAKANKP
jgi:hypothetical protein